MKAVRYHSYGDSGVLAYEDADRPVAGAGQLVLRVAGAAAVHDQAAAGQLPGKTILTPEL
jgi:NADPH:quinone reductase-like Zn-dependent oxidoreductase